MQTPNEIPRLEDIKSSLFTWKDFPVQLPSSLLSILPNSSLAKLFKLTHFEELDDLALDQNGNRKHLDRSQLKQLRRTGQFKVKSIKFEDLFIGWPHFNHGEVDQVITGKRIAFVCSQLTIDPEQKDLLDKFRAECKRLSELRIFKSWEIDKYPDPPFLFQTPNNESIDLRLYYPAFSVKCNDAVEKLIESTRIGWFQDFKNSLINELKDEVKDIDEIKEKVDRLPVIDNHVLGEWLQENFLCMASTLGEDVPMITSTGLGYEDVPKIHILFISTTWIVLKKSVSEYCSKIYNAIRSEQSTSKELGKGIDQLLIDQASFALLLDETKVEFVDAWLTYEADAIEKLERDHSIMFKLREWRRRRISRLREAYFEYHKFDLHENLLAKCREASLRQHAYFVERELVFIREHEPKLRRDIIASDIYPNNEIIETVESPLIMNWRVKNLETGELAPVTQFPIKSSRLPDRRPSQQGEQPSLIRSASTEMGLNELVDDNSDDEYEHVNFDDTDERKYKLEKELKYSYTNRYPFWRWKAFFVRTYVWTINLIFMFLGTIYYDRTKYFETIISTLRRLWRNIRRDDYQFTHGPSDGLLDRRFIRCLYVVWLYVIRGALASFLLVVAWVPTCLILSLLSLAIGICLPVVVPVLSLLIHLLTLIFYDAFALGSSDFCQIFPLLDLVVYRLLICVVFNGLLALFMGLIFFPLTGLFQFIWSLFRYTCRTFWDSIVFNAIVQGLARIPRSDDTIAKRITGPGLGEDHYYKASPDQLMIILVAHMESLELPAWQDQLEHLAYLPFEAHESAVSDFLWLSLTTDFSGQLMMRLRSDQSTWMEKINEAYAQRCVSFHLDIDSNKLRRVKLSKDDLQVLLQSGTEMMEWFYRLRIEPRLGQYQEQQTSRWWSSMSLKQDDFVGLCASVLSQKFTEQIFVALKESDAASPLEMIDPALPDQFRQQLTEAMTRGSFKPTRPDIGYLMEPLAFADIELLQFPIELFRPASSKELPIENRSIMWAHIDRPHPEYSMDCPYGLKRRLPCPCNYGGSRCHRHRSKVDAWAIKRAVGDDLLEPRFDPGKSKRDPPEGSYEICSVELDLDKRRDYWCCVRDLNNSCQLLQPLVKDLACLFNPAIIALLMQPR